jgi:hypothetical protein
MGVEDREVMASSGLYGGQEIKLASLEFDGYGLRWWDSVVHTCQENNELPIITCAI